MPPSCALLGGFAIGARVALLWQHSANAKCQRVLVLALCLVTSSAGAVPKYCDEYVCLWVCLSVHEISPEPHARSLRFFLCVLPVSVAQSRSSTLTIGRIAYRREWVFFPTDNAYISGTSATRAIFSKIFMHVAYVRGSVLIRHVYDRPHRLSPGRGFLPQ